MSDITVLVPYYDVEFSVSWDEYRETSVSDFVVDCIRRAILMSQGRVRHDERNSFTLQIPGGITPSLGALVGESIDRGGFVMLELRQDLLPVDYIRRVLVRGGNPEDEQNIVTFYGDRFVDIRRIYGLLNGMANLVAPVPREVDMSNVTKVINEETFKRVCEIVKVEVPDTTETGDDDCDTVGGPNDGGYGACSICLALVVNKKKPLVEIRKMPNCSHTFHAECLMQWLTKKAITCPVCRSPVVTDKKDYGFIGFDDIEGYTPATEIDDVE